MLSVSLLRDILEGTTTGNRGSDEAHHEGDDQQGNHAVGGNREALAILTIDIGKDKSPYGRETTDNEEHQPLGTGTELGREQL